MSSEQFQLLLKTIRTGDLSQFEDFCAYFNNMEFLDLSDMVDFMEIEDNKEKCYYLALSRLLSSLRFGEFEQLIDHSDKMGIFIEVRKIPFRFKIIADLHLDGMQRGMTGRIFEIIRFFNKYNLFEMNFTNEELELIEDIKKSNRSLVANLKDLFGKVSNSLIFYSCKIMPYDLYLNFVVRVKSYLRNELRSELRGRFNIRFLKNWTDWYSMYGLSVRYLSTVQQFMDTLEKNYGFYENLAIKEKKKDFYENKDFLEFNVMYRTFYDIEENQEYREIKKHFVSLDNVLKNKENILKKDNYKFYSLSMVLFGGLGPQGLGFTYSTPRGEVIEICSDQKEAEAIIIKFKQYLKRKFLGKLDEELENLGIDADIRTKINDYLLELLNPKDLISYYDRDPILKKIRSFLYQIEEFQQTYKSELKSVIKKISKAVTIILRRIKVKDQFITRMDLVAKGKIKSEDIAKLTSLRGKSHYDVLRERFFFQNEINWFFEDYSEEINELDKQFSMF